MINLLIFSAAEKIRIATWNIEHLSGDGRGLGGIGSGTLPPRTENDLKKIANLITNDLSIDLICIQETAINLVSEGKNISNDLAFIASASGNGWNYIVSNPASGVPSPDIIHNLQCAFLWNSKKVKLNKCFNLTFPNEAAGTVGEKHLFDRLPLIGYFEPVKEGLETNDFIVINVHLASGQNNDENHIAAMIILEQKLNDVLKQNQVTESDRIVLGDFNDNPFALNSNETYKYSNLLYDYMKWKEYEDLVTIFTGATRMDDNLKSIIDHMLLNKGAKKYLVFNSFKKYMPSANKEKLALWRKSFSDHFPLYIDYKVAETDDDVDWK